MLHGKIYDQLNIEEQTKTQLQLEAGLWTTAISLVLNISPLTISPEHRRNGWMRDLVLCVRQWLEDSVPKPPTCAFGHEASCLAGNDAYSYGARCESRL